jgi:hypothetical protein
MDDQVKRKRGGQLTYDREISHVVCVELMKGKSLKAICRQEGFPPEATVRAWAREDVDGFAARYACCRQIGLDVMADQLLELADDGSKDHKLDGHGNLVPDHEHIARCRLQIDVRKWYLAKLAPKRYGDKVDVNVGGQENPVAGGIRWEK